MNCRRISLTAMLVAATTTSLLTGTSGAAGGHAARKARLQLRQTGLGKILVNASGFTLYEFTRDSARKSACVKISGCAGVWPALTTSGKPAAGPGVRSSLISTIRLPGGATQVTYAGHPLYTYVADPAPGDTSYVGANQFGGKWYALNGAGHTVR